MKILSRLFKSHEGTRKILDGIRELGVEMTPTMTKEAEDMAYVGDAPYTQGWDEGREEGLKKGLEKKSIDVAQKMIAKGTFDNDTISELTGLTIEQIDELRNS